MHFHGGATFSAQPPQWPTSSFEDSADPANVSCATNASVRVPRAAQIDVTGGDGVVRGRAMLVLPGRGRPPETFAAWSLARLVQRDRGTLRETRDTCEVRATLVFVLPPTT